MEEKKLTAVERRRCVVAILLFLLMMASLVLRLMEFQLKDGEKYLATAQKTTVKTVSVDAPRGEILDCYGRALAVNRTAYCVQIDLLFLPSASRNEIILKLINIMEDEGEEYFDELPVSLSFPYSFTENSDGARLRMKGVLSLSAAPESANVIMNVLKERYKISDTVSEENARKICGVRYTMELRGASQSTPYIFAEDVGLEAVTTVKENSVSLIGCDVVTKGIRQYYYSDAAPDIVGLVGIIDEKELEAKKESGYVPTDYIGKFGIEKSMEEQLRGEKGEMQVTLNSRGQVIDSKIIKEAKPGAAIVLTIDVELQRTAAVLLKQRIEEIAEEYEGKDGEDCEAGSLVLTDPNTGGIIVAVNYPSYDLENYYSDYSALLNEKNNPLFNRAMQGLYPPGSTFKPVTAFAGLEKGAISASSKHTCHRVTTYSGREYRCTGYHGAIEIVTAIAKSCNIYFYNTGLAVGFDSITEMAEAFGFGSATGVEIAEQSGRISQSNIMMTSIGQADTLVTPLQLSAYAAVLANGGTLYRSTLVKKVMSYDFSETLLSGEPEIKGTLDVTKSHFASVTEGLYAGVNKKLASYYTNFVGADYIVASKTGTAQVSSGSANGMFICYAPFEEPVAAIGIALEHAGGGARCALLARRLLDEFFIAGERGDSFTGEGKI